MFIIILWNTYHYKFIKTSSCHTKCRCGFQIFSARLCRNCDQTSPYLSHISLPQLYTGTWSFNL